jgi:hypothetical protein
MASLAGCPQGGSDAGVGNSSPDSRRDNISDGTSNTIQLGEQSGSQGGRNDGNGAPGDGSVRNVSDGTSNTIQAGQQQARSDQAAADAALQRIRTRLNDRVFEFASASGNSDNDAFVTGVTDLELCSLGRFRMREFTSFTSSVGDFSSEEFSDGTWSLQIAAGQAVIQLQIESSTDTRSPSSRQFVVAVDSQTASVLIAGQPTQEDDAAADCAAAARP